MLFILPILVLATALCSGYFSLHPLQTIPVKGLINVPYIDGLNKISLSIAGFVLVVLLAFMIFFISERFKLLSQTTTLPSLIYVLLVSGIMINIGFDYLLIAVFVVALAVERLQRAIDLSKSNAALFDFGFLILLAVAIYPKLIFLILWALCVIFFSGRTTLKDLVALCIGLLTPLLLILFYYFWVDRLDQFMNLFMNNLLMGEFMYQLPLIELIRLGMLFLLLLVALYHLSTKYPLLMVNQRRGLLSLVSMLLFLVLTLFLIPGNLYNFMYMLALPLSFIYAQYFITSRVIAFSNLMFIWLLSACFLIYLV
ncbi:MAG: hypothetical protein RSC80_09400 [Odoribacter sp.]